MPISFPATKSFKSSEAFPSTKTFSTNPSWIGGTQSVASLVFHIQPSGAVAGSPFTTQPVVWAVDSHGDLVTSASANVVMSIAGGSGVLSGTLTVPLVAGVAAFTDLSFDAAGQVVTLQAAAYLFAVNSALFTVALWTQSAPDTVDLSTLGTLVTYLRSDQNASAASWTDFATGDILAQATGGNQPLVLSDNQNHRPTLSFGANDFLTLAGYNRLSSLTAATGFFVFSHTAEILNSEHVLWSPGGAQFQIHIETSPSPILYVYVNGTNFGGFAFPSTVPVLLSVVFDGSQTGNANRLKVWLNGDQQTLTFTGTIPAAFSATTGVDLGRVFGADAAYWNSSINEITIFNSAFSDANRLAAQRSIGNRWGVIGAPVTTVDGTVSSDAYRIMLPPVGIRNGAVMVMFHGSGQSEQDVLTSALNLATVARLLNSGYIVAAGLGGSTTHWGNQTAIDKAVALINLVESNYSTTKTFLFGQSMGSLAALIGIYQAAYAHVLGAYEVISVTNLANMHGTTYSTQIDAAYNIPGGGNYATQTAGHDPNLLSPSVFAGKKFRFVVSDDDTVVVASANGELLEPAIASAVSEASLVKGSGDHGDPSCFRADDVLATLARWIA